MHSLPSKKESPKQLRKKRKPEATISKMEIVQKEGNREVARQVDFYNLDAIISVGYRVNSFRATNFASGYCVLRQFAVRVHIPLDFEPDKD